MRAEPDRQPWLLLAPVLSLLILLLVVPIAIMVVFTFYTFVTAGVEKPVLTLANWREFLSDPYYPRFPVEDGPGRHHHRLGLRGHGISGGLFHCHDPLPAQMAAPAPADRAFLDQLHHPDLLPGSIFSASRAPSMSR